MCPTHPLWYTWKPIVHQRSAFSSPPASPTDFNAALTGVSALAILPPVVIDGRMMDEMTGIDVELMKSKLAAAGTWFRGMVHNDRLGWRSALEHPSDVLVREARYADLW